MVTLDGRLRLAPNVGWREVAITPLLADALRAVGCEELPFQVLNDANAGALGESIFGAAPATRSLVFLGVGHGIGAGIVMDERLHAGHEGLSGEVGHSILDRGGLPCGCGRRGCAETLLSQRAVSRLVTGREEPVLTVNELQARLEAGDARVDQVLREAGGHLGLLVHNLVVTIDPALVVLGGTMSRLVPFVETAIDEFLRLSGQVPDHHVIVRATRFGPVAGAIGAAASVLHDLGRAVELTP
jgi:predicted NBD/HSP70 family sugar kinase